MGKAAWPRWRRTAGRNGGSEVSWPQRQVGRERAGRHGQCRAPQPPPARIEKEFASVTDLGIHDIKYRERVLHQIQLFECRALR